MLCNNLGLLLAPSSFRSFPQRLVKLFSGVSIFLVAQEQREALSELIRMGGGKVCGVHVRFFLGLILL
mgnify:CR=1 FL=1